jgi:hypothetical protein
VASGTNSTAVGGGATASGAGSTAVGQNSLAFGPDDTAVGFNSRVGADQGTALGSNSSIAAGATNATAIGANAKVTASGTNSVALGAGSVADEANTVSIGTAAAGRRLVNVADGINQYDGANFGQVEKAYTGVAMSFAMSAVNLNLNVGEQGVAAGLGTFEGKTAGSVRYQARPTEALSIGAGVSFGDNAVGGSAGVGFKW